MSASSGIDQLIGEWQISGDVEIEGQTIQISGHTTVERLGQFVVLRAQVQPPEFPDNLSIIGGGPEGGPSPMHYFDERGVHRLYLSTVAEGRWVITRADETWRESPGFNQRYLGEISLDGSRITGAWERGLGDAGDRWQIDFRVEYERVR